MKKIFLLLAILIGQSLPAFSELPSDSIYQLSFNWKDQSGANFLMSSLQGKPVILTLAYTRCKSACPLTMQRMKKLQADLAAAGLSPEFVIVSLDPVRDDSASMRQFQKHYALKENNWRLLTGDSESLRKLSVLLNYSYQKKPDGTAGDDIAHSNKIIVLDKGGVLVYELEGLGSSLHSIIEKIKVISGG